MRSVPAFSLRNRISARSSPSSAPKSSMLNGQAAGSRPPAVVQRATGARTSREQQCKGGGQRQSHRFHEYRSEQNRIAVEREFRIPELHGSDGLCAFSISPPIACDCRFFRLTGKLRIDRMQEI